MSFQRFYQIIEKSFIGRFLEKRINVLEHTNPDRIYIENVRSFYNMPFWAAKFFCELAVKEGIFRRRIGIVCPNDGRIIQTIDNLSEIPETITCINCQQLEIDKYEFSKSDVKTIIFYQSLL
jgi:hypothetical protein